MTIFLSVFCSQKYHDPLGQLMNSGSAAKEPFHAAPVAQRGLRHSIGHDKASQQPWAPGVLDPGGALALPGHPGAGLQEALGK